MLIHNLRIGFATNSSSTHSIIFMRPDAKVVDNDCKAAEFGWKYFTAVSPEAKKLYVATTLFSNLQSRIGSYMARLVVKELCGIDFDRFDNGHVDHQSRITIPRGRERCDYDTPPVNEEYLKEFTYYLMRPGVAILGGNDNGGSDHPSQSAGEELSALWPICEWGSLQHVVARKDEKYGYWTLFDQSNGNKVRFQFSDEASPAPSKAFAPELVDLKITSRCPFVDAPCYPYCYQDSSPKQAHADENTIGRYLYALEELGVFEVAIGGGEPTFHPQFVSILRDCRRCDIVPNFTTRSLHWLRDVNMARQVEETVGGFAYSVNTADDVDNLHVALKNAAWKNVARVSIQHVVGSSYYLQEIIKAAAQHDMSVTLLGFKSHGRGGKPAVESATKDWLEQVVELRDKRQIYCRIGADTKLIESVTPAQLREASVDPILVTPGEGKFSAYIDAVEDKFGPSSFCDPSLMVPIQTKDAHSDEIARQLTTAFEGW